MEPSNSTSPSSEQRKEDSFPRRTRNKNSTHQGHPTIVSETLHPRVRLESSMDRVPVQSHIYSKSWHPLIDDSWMKRYPNLTAGNCRFIRGDENQKAPFSKCQLITSTEEAPFAGPHTAIPILHGLDRGMFFRITQNLPTEYVHMVLATVDWIWNKYATAIAPLGSVGGVDPCVLPFSAIPIETWNIIGPPGARYPITDTTVNLFAGPRTIIYIKGIFWESWYLHVPRFLTPTEFEIAKENLKEMCMRPWYWGTAKFDKSKSPAKSMHDLLDWIKFERNQKDMFRFLEEVIGLDFGAQHSHLDLQAPDIAPLWEARPKTHQASGIEQRKTPREILYVAYEEADLAAGEVFDDNIDHAPKDGLPEYTAERDTSTKPELYSKTEQPRIALYQCYRERRNSGSTIASVYSGVDSWESMADEQKHAGEKEKRMLDLLTQSDSLKKDSRNPSDEAEIGNTEMELSRGTPNVTSHSSSSIMLLRSENEGPFRKQPVANRTQQGSEKLPSLLSPLECSWLLDYVAGIVAQESHPWSATQTHHSDSKSDIFIQSPSRNEEKESPHVGITAEEIDLSILAWASRIEPTSTRSLTDDSSLNDGDDDFHEELRNQPSLEIGSASSCKSLLKETFPHPYTSGVGSRIDVSGIASPGFAAAQSKDDMALLYTMNKIIRLNELYEDKVLSDDIQSTIDTGLANLDKKRAAKGTTIKWLRRIRKAILVITFIVGIALDRAYRIHQPIEILTLNMSHDFRITDTFPSHPKRGTKHLSFDSDSIISPLWHWNPHLYALSALVLHIAATWAGTHVFRLWSYLAKPIIRTVVLLVIRTMECLVNPLAAVYCTLRYSRALTHVRQNVGFALLAHIGSQVSCSWCCSPKAVVDRSLVLRVLGETVPLNMLACEPTPGYFVVGMLSFVLMAERGEGEALKERLIEVLITYGLVGVGLHPRGWDT